MTERIYTRDQQGQLKPLEEEHFVKEEELQALIAEHPEVLDGTQMRPDAPLRWILIAREQGIAESSDAAARWAVDHLLVDQDAVPTLVEVKRGANPEIRRAIVGQMLEYAAHARTWTAESLRLAFEESTDDPNEELGKLLVPDGEGEPDADGFWERVATNLAAARLRLLFVADDIPDQLERVVEFLNAQMAGIEVLAVEIKQFKGDSKQTLVPRVIGRTAASLARAHHDNHLGRSKITESDFIELLSRSSSPEVVRFAEWVIKNAPEPEHGLTIVWGDAGPLLKYKDAKTDRSFTFGQLSWRGTLASTHRLSGAFRKHGLDRSICRRYLDQVADLMGATVYEDRTPSGKEQEGIGKGVKKGEPLDLLAARGGPEWFKIINATVQDIRKALEIQDN